ncbi:uncharacterized protein LOC123557238 isoform X2 [Mercenaria mercenaria]|uniref:uncharacterized protein LOC123557238 isoform X2 n=1 Tax=Mercenaria mercenaria TaxID=6596 RepID=UPI00234F1038|nr:uncharacterized protein LOC123557238 isoform X2 [Mercenaria mercenaria]
MGACFDMSKWMLIYKVKYNVYISAFQNTKPGNESLQRELEQLRADHSVLAKELDYHTQKAKQDAVKTNDGYQDNSKLREECENFKQELESLRTVHSTTKQEVAQYKETEKSERQAKTDLEKSVSKLKEDYERLRHELEKQRANYNTAKQELEQYKNKEKLERKANFDMKHREKEKIVGQEQGHSKAMEKLRQHNIQLNEEKDRLLDQINELRNRLSVMAGHKLTDGNPGIADLSDPYRPTNLAERFRQLYDDEWTHAFEELEKHFTNREEDVINILANIIKDVDHFCDRAGRQQFGRLKHYAKLVILEPHYQHDGKEKQPLKCDSSVVMSKAQEEFTDKLLKDFRKSLGILSKTRLVQIFNDVCMSKLMWNNRKIPVLKGLNDFLDRTLELVWMMKIQDPPMEFTWSKEGDKFDKNMYTPYTIRGNTVAQCVWPAVVLHRDGPLMSKGVVQGK